ncbi:30S ribosomal protein S5 [bacterium]|nr:30S ribosomal protein S5 [bacterium]
MFHNKREPKIKSEYESELLDLARVTRVTAGGKQLRFRAVVVVGNKKGKVGVGVSKGTDVGKAIEKATRLAKKNIVEIPIVENGIPYVTEAKYSSSRVLIRPQSQGRGLVAGGPVRVVCRLLGLKDISAKILSKSRNKLTIARATIKALEKLKSETRAEQD